MKESLCPIDPKKVVIARRWSKYEYDLHTKGWSEEEALSQYRQTGTYERKMSSHLRQMDTFNNLWEFLGRPKYTIGEAINESDFKDAQLIIALGGDGHFSYVSHFVDDKPVIGINADTERSVAALLYFNLDTFYKYFPKVVSGKYIIEEWTRLQATVDGKVVFPLALSDIYVGSKWAVDMSRYIISYQGKTEEQKTSGIIVSTGTGSTGWHKKAFITQQRRLGIFPRSERLAKFIIREEPVEELSEYSITSGELRSGETLVISSLTDEGMISPDSYKKVYLPFNSGTEVKIEVSNRPLKVVNINKE